MSDAAGVARSGMSGRGVLSPVEKRAFDALDLDALAAFLRELIAIPCLDGAESSAQRAVGAWMERAGFATDIWRIDLRELAKHPDHCTEVERHEALGVVGWVGERAAERAAGGAAAGRGAGRSGPGRDLMLNGHIDVVPVGDEAAWTTPPWDPAVRDGRVYGRGAVDMKGGLVCALFAAKAVHDAGVRLCGRLSVRQCRGGGRRRHGHTGDHPPRPHRPRRRCRRAHRVGCDPGAGRLADVPPHRPGLLGARVCA